MVDRLFDDNEMEVLEECRKDIAKMVDDLAIKLYKGGKIKSKFLSLCCFIIFKQF